MGKDSDELKYLEGNYSDIQLKAVSERWEDEKQARELLDVEEYMKAYLHYVESKRDEHHYLVNDTILTCTRCTKEPKTPIDKEFTAPKGSDEVLLKVTKNQRYHNGAGQYFATVDDSKKFDNIEPFGNCKNPPDRDDEIRVLTMAGESEELRKLGTCRYLMKLNDKWENMISDIGYQEVAELNKAGIEGITMESILFCKHGGFIYPKTSGYIETAIEDDTEMDTKLFIKTVLETLGWPIDEIELDELDAILKDFDIIDRNSIACFLLICRSETGEVGYKADAVGRDGKPYVNQLGRCVTEYYPEGYEAKVKYEFEERGVGYMHITGKSNQLACLTYLQEHGYYSGDIDPNAVGYVNELREMPWAASAWRWAVYSQPVGSHLNNYVAERAAENGNCLTKGIFLTAESFINGLVQGEVSEVLGKIARGKVDWEVNQNNRLIVGDKSYLAPNNWQQFENNYNTLKDNEYLGGIYH